MNLECDLCLRWLRCWDVSTVRGMVEYGGGSVWDGWCVVSEGVGCIGIK